MDRIYIIKFSEPQDIVRLVKEYGKNSAVEYAEPDYIGYGHFLPNGIYFSNQWGLHNTGQNPSGQQSTKYLIIVSMTMATVMSMIHWVKTLSPIIITVRIITDTAQ